MTESVSPFPPTTVPIGADCVKNGTCPRYPSVIQFFTSAAAKAASEEFDLELNPNGSAGISTGQRFLRFAIRMGYHLTSENAKTISKLPPGNGCAGACLLPSFNPGDAPNLDAF